MSIVNVALLGFGNVNRALAELLLEKRAALLDGYGIEVQVVGISTGSHGLAVDPDGIDLETALSLAAAGETLSNLHIGAPADNLTDFLAFCPADLIFEGTPTNPIDGQPALTYVRQALERGIHVVTANKGPVAFGYRELDALAEAQGVGFFFESTVIGGAPAIALAREGLPAAEFRRIEGIFNSTTNYILDRMESEGIGLEEALREAQEIGVAETDPSLDIDGWDAAIKTVILANVFLGADLRPVDVERTGIREITVEQIRTALDQGKRTRLLCEAQRLPDGRVQARVAPQRVPADSLLAGIRGTGSLVSFEIDTMGRQMLIDAGQGPRGTAYGMLADMINILRGRSRKRL